MFLCMTEPVLVMSIKRIELNTIYTGLGTFFWAPLTLLQHRTVCVRVHLPLLRSRDHAGGERLTFPHSPGEYGRSDRCLVFS